MPFFHSHALRKIGCFQNNGISKSVKFLRLGRDLSFSGHDDLLMNVTSFFDSLNFLWNSNREQTELRRDKLVVVWKIARFVTKDKRQENWSYQQRKRRKCNFKISVTWSNFMIKVSNESWALYLYQGAWIYWVLYKMRTLLCWQYFMPKVVAF